METAMYEYNRQLAQEHASKEFILSKTGIDEYLDFIEEQLDKPFDCGDNNYYAKMMKMISHKHLKQTYAKAVIDYITDKYENIEVNLEDTDANPVEVAECLYKFLGKNVHKLVPAFLREFIFNNKNRKMLLAEYSESKIPSYPKEQFGTKENYILLIKLKNIIENIMSLNVQFDQFINYAIRNGDKPKYIEDMQKYIDEGVIVDYGFYSDIMEKLSDSDSFDSLVNKLQVKMIEGIIRPTLEEMNYTGLALAFDIEEDPSEEDDESDTSGDDLPIRVNNFSEDI